jgi:hypothetical protein
MILLPMNPPGKALKRGVTQVTAAAPAHAITIDKLPPKAARTSERSAAPAFRILGLLLLTVGILALGAGVIRSFHEGTGFYAIASGMACLFWSALMYAIAEVLTRLGEISAAVRKRAGE